MGNNVFADRQDLKERLDKAVSELKAQCGDSASFDACMDRILSLKGQMDTEAVRLLVKESDVLRESKGDTFYIAVAKQCAIYHTYGGYTVVADNRNASSLYTVLAEACDLMAEGEDAVDETAYADMLAKLHVINAPTWCFTDVDATYGIASAALQQLNDLADRLLAEPLREEDFAANHDFEDAVRGAEHLDKAIKEDEANGQA